MNWKDVLKQRQIQKPQRNLAQEQQLREQQRWGWAGRQQTQLPPGLEGEWFLENINEDCCEKVRKLFGSKVPNYPEITRVMSLSCDELLKTFLSLSRDTTVESTVKAAAIEAIRWYMICANLKPPATPHTIQRRPHRGNVVRDI